MTDLQIFSEFSSLPQHLKKEVQDFIQFLKSKASGKKPQKERKFGALKGFFIMHENFNDPIEDFNEYM